MSTHEPKQTAEACLKVVYDWMRRYDRKFTDGDVTNELEAAALDWLAQYRGDFPFLVSVKRGLTSSHRRKLSIGMARGVLNCMRAEVLKGLTDDQKDELARGAVAATYHQTLPPAPPKPQFVGMVSGGARTYEEVFGEDEPPLPWSGDEWEEAGSPPF